MGYIYVIKICSIKEILCLCYISGLFIAFWIFHSRDNADDGAVDVAHIKISHRHEKFIVVYDSVYSYECEIHMPARATNASIIPFACA